MKRTLLFLLFAVVIASCYKDEATYTVQISGYAQKYKIDYRDIDGQWIEGLTVDKGFAFYDEYTHDWNLDLVVVAPDSIFVTVLKRGDYMETIKGKDTLEIHKTIKY